MFDEQTERAIQDRLDELFGDMPVQRLSRQLVEHVLRACIQEATQNVARDTLMSLKTADELAEQFGVSARRIRALASNRHERFGIGWQVPGTGQWLFRPDEVGLLRPDERYK